MPKKSKVKWVKDVPNEDGWYWVKFNGRISPVRVVWLDFDGGIRKYVVTGYYVSFTSGVRKGLGCSRVRFGPRIEEPE